MNKRATAGSNNASQKAGANKLTVWLSKAQKLMRDAFSLCVSKNDAGQPASQLIL